MSTGQELWNRPARNGAASLAEELGMEAEPLTPAVEGDAIPNRPDERPPDKTVRRAVREDRNFAAISWMMLRSAEILEPVVAMLSRRLLGWATLGISAGLAFYAIRDFAWERVAVVAVFMILAPWLVRKIG